MRVLVTGCAGFIGYFVARRLVERGYKVLCFDDLSRGSLRRVEELVGLGLVFERRDVRSVERVEADVVMHLAALVSVEESWERPELYHDVNAGGTLRMVLASVKSGVRRFIYASSAAVYGEPIYTPIDENHPTRPINPYGASKLAGEAYVHAYSSRMEVVVLRLFNVYGPGQNPAYAGVITRFVERAVRGEPPIIYGDGAQTRDFVHVEDVARAFEWAITAPPDTYNIGTGRPTRIRDLAEMVVKAFNLGKPPIYAPPRPGDIRHSTANIEKAATRGWKPTKQLNQNEIRNIGLSLSL